MDTVVHELIGQAVYDALPRKAQEAFPLSDVEIDYYCRAPDEVYKDNLWMISACEGDNRYHSYKLEWDRKTDAMTLVTGSVHDALQSEVRVIHNAVMAGRFEEAKIHFAQMAHYCVDACTLPHLTHELTRDQHGQFEHQLKDYILKEKSLPLGEQLIQHPSVLLTITKDLRGATEQVCRDTVRLQLDAVKAVMARGKITDDIPLCQSIVARCEAFTLAVWLYIWRLVCKISPGVE